MADYVFGYGLLLGEEFQGEAAVLRDWRLDFSGFATVNECEDEVAYGVLVPVDDERLTAFDRMEGYRPGDPYGGLYHRRRVTAERVGLRHDPQNGERVEAWVYVMNEVGFGQMPSVSYLAVMLREYLRLGLPVEKLSEALHRAPFRVAAWSRHARKLDRSRTVWT